MLDELGTLSSDVQAKLVRVPKTRRVPRIDSSSPPAQLIVRSLAATNVQSHGATDTRSALCDRYANVREWVLNPWSNTRDSLVIDGVAEGDALVRTVRGGDATTTIGGLRTSRCVGVDASVGDAVTGFRWARTAPTR